MVERAESPDETTIRYRCEECGTTYVHKGDAINCEKRCSLENMESDSLFTEDDSPSKSWTDYSLEELD